ncbi:MAG TPA: acyltransferase [Longimicrobium sp.]|nr:acyltransferase [Longimicrobium sp.]
MDVSAHHPGDQGTSRAAAAAAIPDRFHSLDVIRGLAALAVVFWHWQHFFYQGTEPGRVASTAQPLYALFSPFYERGWLAVYFFFSLSGFIFYWLYSDTVSRRTVRFREFAVLRASRLYPLHLATLLIVAALQLLALQRTGGFWVYANNDAYHFGLNLLLVSEWGIARGRSFNAPVWSISIEVFLYILFFLYCRLVTPRAAGALALAAVGLVVREVHEVVGSGIFSFFMGGLAFLAYRALAARRITPRLVRVLAALCVLGWVVALVELRMDFVPAPPQEGTVTGGALQHLLHALLTGLLMPGTILTAAVAETVRGSLGKRVAFLGDISYSSYLLHFPLQLVWLHAAALLGMGSAIFLRPATLILFFAVLIPLSLASYHYFERPAQRFLRSRLHAARGAAASRSPAAAPPNDATRPGGSLAGPAFPVADAPASGR